jgi:type IV pilus assembly protein PilY1
MRGQIFRIDIDNDNNTNAATLATGGLIAQLGDGTAAGNRRFYYAPDVSLSRDRSHLNISIGSGYRAHPLDTAVHDAFFVIHDYNLSGPAVDGSGNPVYTSIAMSDLYDATSNIIVEGNTGEIATATAALAASQGFYIWLNEADGSFVGEKVLAKSLTFSDKVIFTTYKPVGGTAGACSPSQGSASAYLISSADGSAVNDYNLSGDPIYTREDRRIDLVRGGIPPEPSIIFHENGPVILIGTEKGPEPDIMLQPQKTYWHVE